MKLSFTSFDRFNLRFIHKMKKIKKINKSKKKSKSKAVHRHSDWVEQDEKRDKTVSWIENQVHIDN